MKLAKIPFWARILFFIIIFPFGIYSQTSEQTLAFAQWSHAQAKYAEAAEACERIIFFEERKNVLAATYFQLANSHLAQNNYSQAIENFSRVKEFTDPTDSIALEAEFGSIICHILRNDPHYAMISLIDLKSEMPAYFQRKKRFFAAIVNFKIEDYSSAERDFIALLNNNDTLLVKEIFVHLIREKKKINPRKARILSMIFPGSGQLYTGDYKNAAKSFLLNAAIIAAGVHFAYTYTILDAYLFTSNWFFRYYKGGFLKAQANAEKKIAFILDSSFNQLMALTEAAVKIDR